MASSDDLATLVTVIEEGSLSAAGRRLGVSGAMVSRRLTAMERRLGARLIARTTRTLRPTNEGAELADRARRILADIAAAEEAVASGTGAMRGNVSVLVPISFGRHRIAPIIGRFCAANPGVSVELDLVDRAVDMVEGGYDLQLSIGQPMGESLVTRRLVAARRAVVAAPSFWDRVGIPATPGDLRGLECILLRRGRMVMDRWMFRTQAGPNQVQVSGRLSSNSGEVTHAWALEGLGVALKSLWDVEGDLQAGRLVEVLAEQIDERADLYACYPTRRFLPERVRALLDQLVSELA